eukprot:Ihof_evm2s651 gene=Ihof_evmTU2s651
MQQMLNDEVEIVRCHWQECNEVFLNVRLLHRHVLSNHIGSVRDGQEVCLQCKWEDCKEAQSGKVFRRRYSITSHMLVHVPLFQFNCEVCSRGFKRKSDLNKHAPLCKKGGVAEDDTQVAIWTKEQVAQWLQVTGQASFIPLFLENDIDGKLLLNLTHSFLKLELDIKSAGKREALLMMINRLRKSHIIPLASTISGANANSPSSVNILLSPHDSPEVSLEIPYQPLPNGNQIDIDPLTGTGLLGSDLLGQRDPADPFRNCLAAQKGSDIDLDLVTPFKGFDCTFPDDSDELSCNSSAHTYSPEVTVTTPQNQSTDQMYHSRPLSNDMGRQVTNNIGKVGEVKRITGQVKRPLPQDEGSENRPDDIPAQFLAQVALRMSVKEMPMTNKDLLGILDGYGPDKIVEVEAMLDQITQTIKQCKTRRETSDPHPMMTPDSSTWPFVSLPTAPSCSPLNTNGSHTLNYSVQPRPTKARQNQLKESMHMAMMQSSAPTNSNNSVSNLWGNNLLANKMSDWSVDKQSPLINPNDHISRSSSRSDMTQSQNMLYGHGQGLGIESCPFLNETESEYPPPSDLSSNKQFFKSSREPLSSSIDGLKTNNEVPFTFNFYPTPTRSMASSLTPPFSCLRVIPPAVPVLPNKIQPTVCTHDNLNKEDTQITDSNKDISLNNLSNVEVEVEVEDQVDRLTVHNATDTSQSAAMLTVERDTNTDIEVDGKEDLVASDNISHLSSSLFLDSYSSAPSDFPDIPHIPDIECSNSTNVCQTETLPSSASTTTTSEVDKTMKKEIAQLDKADKADKGEAVVEQED